MPLRSPRSSTSRTEAPTTHAAPTPPPPWHLLAEIAVGGLYAIGFVPDTEDLLVVSSQGRGLYRVPSGERIARDHDASWSWYRESPPTAQGIGLYSDLLVPVAGVDGGTSLTETQDGWRLHMEPGGVLCLQSAGGIPVPFSPRWRGEEIRAFGFSASGQSLAVAVGSHTLEIYTRQEDP